MYAKNLPIYKLQNFKQKFKIAKASLTFTKVVQYAMRNTHNFKLLQNVVLIMFQNSTYTTISIS